MKTRLMILAVVALLIHAGGLVFAQGGQTPEDIINTLVEQGYLTSSEGAVAAELSYYQLDLTGEDFMVTWQNIGEDRYSNFVTGTTIYWGPGHAEDGCGFVFRFLDSDNYSLIIIDRNGRTWFSKISNGYWQDDIEMTRGPINTGMQDSNQLVLLIVEDTITVYLNGQYAAQMQELDYGPGQVAVGMVTYDRSDVTYCNFIDSWVWQLPGEVVAAVPTVAPVTSTSRPVATTVPTVPPIIPTPRPLPPPICGEDAMFFPGYEIVAMLPFPGEYGGDVTVTRSMNTSQGVQDIEVPVGIILEPGRDYTRDIKFDETAPPSQESDVGIDFNDPGSSFAYICSGTGIEIVMGGDPEAIWAGQAQATIDYRGSLISMVQDGGRRVLLRGSMTFPVADPWSKKVERLFEFRFLENASIVWDSEAGTYLWYNIEFIELPPD